MQEMWNSFTDQVGTYLPQFLVALAVLIVGTLVAFVIAAIVRGVLHRTTLDDKLARLLVGEERAARFQVEEWIGRGVFCLVMVFVLVAFFQKLGLTEITEPLKNMLTELLEYGPNLIGAALLLFLAWILASVLRLLVTKGLTTIQLDDRLNEKVGAPADKRFALTQPLGSTVYWITFALFLPAILDTLALQGPLEPITQMFNKVIGFLPNLIAAAVILLVGWVVARVVQRIVSNLLAAIGLDGLSDRVGLAAALGKQKLSDVVGLVVYVLILIPVLISALNSLDIEAITAPATSMLAKIFEALPNLFAAGLILVVAYFVGRVVDGLVSNLLRGVGFNNILTKLGIGGTIQEGQRGPSEVVGHLVLVAIMLFASMEAAELLAFTALAMLISEFLGFAGHIILGIVILGIGLFLANLAASTIRTSEHKNAGLLATAARIAIVILSAAMALRQMELANEIIEIAFGTLLGAIAVAVAISFGLGGKEIATEILRDWKGKCCSKEQQ